MRTRSLWLVAMVGPLAVAGLLAAFHEAVDDYLDVCAKAGKDPQKAFSGKLMLRIDPKVHARAAAAAEVAGKSLNQWGEQVIREAADRIVA